MNDQQLRRSLRLAELRDKRGTAHEDVALPAWLDTFEGAMAERQAGAGDPFNAVEPKPKAEPRFRIPLKAPRPEPRPNLARAIVEV